MPIGSTEMTLWRIMDNDKVAERVARALHPLKITLVVKASRSVSWVIVEGYAFYDSWRADDKADEMRNSPDFNDDDDDVCVIYDVLVE